MTQLKTTSASASDTSAKSTGAARFKVPITCIILHCTATEEGRSVSLEELHRWHRSRGFLSCGYHYVVHRDGRVERNTTRFAASGLPLVGAHTAGWNFFSLAVVYVGGLRRGVAADTRTPRQKAAMHHLVSELRACFTTVVQVLGHRDVSVDRNHDGRLTPDEWVKSCPCFDVQAEQWE